MHTLLIRNGRLVTAGDIWQADIRIEDGVIADIGENLPAQGIPTYDAAGCTIYPGFIDAHTHMDMESAAGRTADDFDSGSRAALAGGTTTLIDFATQDRGATLQQGLDAWHKKADGKTWCDYGFHMAVTDWNERTAQELPMMFAQGVSSFKVYMAYENLRLRDGDIFALMRAAKQHGGIVSCHCENGDLVQALIEDFRAQGKRDMAYHPLSRPGYVEGEAVRRFLAIARAAEAPAYIVHMSSAEGLEAAWEAREAGQRVAVETCPQYLLLTDAVYSRPAREAAKYVCSPPVRTQSDRDSLWWALDWMDVIATDHCSFRSAGQKELGWEDFSLVPNGLPGIEHRPQLIYTYGVKRGLLDEARMVALLSENPARIFGLYPQKGTIAVGSDADLVIWQDGDGEVTAADMRQNVDYTPYEGMHTAGGPRAVFLRGRQVAQEGRIIEEGGPGGRYLPRKAADLSSVGVQSI